MGKFALDWCYEKKNTQNRSFFFFIESQTFRMQCHFAPWDVEKSRANSIIPGKKKNDNGHFERRKKQQQAHIE